MNDKISIYISNASDVTQPIISKLRSVIVATIPDIEENIKWNAPIFEKSGQSICSIMAFKKHVNFIFQHGKELVDQTNILVDIGAKSKMKGIKNITSLDDLPPVEVLQNLLLQAIKRI